MHCEIMKEFSYYVDVNARELEAFQRDPLTGYIMPIVESILQRLSRDLEPGLHKVYYKIRIFDIGETQRQCWLSALLKFNSVEEAVMFRLRTGYNVMEGLDETVYSISLDHKILDRN